MNLAGVRILVLVYAAAAAVDVATVGIVVKRWKREQVHSCVCVGLRCVVLNTAYWMQQMKIENVILWVVGNAVQYNAMCMI